LLFARPARGQARPGTVPAVCHQLASAVNRAAHSISGIQSKEKRGENQAHTVVVVPVVGIVPVAVGTADIPAIVVE